MIVVKNVNKDYGYFRAVNNVSFEIQKGEIVGFLGPNGAGKTTMMRVLTGYLPATSGEAYIDNYEVHKDPANVKKRIGYLPENPPVYPEMRVSDYLKFVGRLKGLSEDKVNERLEYVLDAVQIRERSKQIISTLSRGFKQRVGLAQTLIHDPEVLILDEPTVGLDPNQIIEIRNLIKSLGGEKTIIFSTHILPEVVLTCKRVLVISAGQLVADESVGNLLAYGGKDIDVNDLMQSYKNSEGTFLKIINREVEFKNE